MAWDSIIDEIRKEFNRHDAVKSSSKLLENEILRFSDFQNGTAGRAQYTKSLEFLSACLMKTYEKKVIILIDEYDVLLENAWSKYFYGEMVDYMSEYLVKSNRESGNGRSDILVRSLDVRYPPIIMELKVSDTYRGMEAACDKTLAQIKHREYASWLPEEGYTEVWNYGISFYRKQ